MDRQIENETSSSQYEERQAHVLEAPLLLMGIIHSGVSQPIRRIAVPELPPLALEPPFHDNFAMSGPVNDPATFSKLVEIAKEV